MISKTVNRKYINLVLFIIGATYWYFFYFKGLSPIAHADWVKEQVYLDTIRFSITNRLVPWAWESSFYHGATLFMANPETIFTPDILLLPYISNNHFFYLHHLIFYTISFYLLNRIAHRWQLTMPAYLLIYLLFNFNGYITSHLSEGHFQWIGYYLIPAVLYFLYNSYHQTTISRSDLLAGMALGVLFVNGSFHIAIWLSLFALFLFIFDRRTWLKLVVIIIVGYFIGLFRVLPALFYFPAASTKGLQSGYTNISLILDALTQLRGYGYGVSTIMGWWEYNLYIGFTGFFLLTVGLILFFKRTIKNNYINLHWSGAVLLMLLLSLGNTWGILSTLQLPFGSIERVSSRFIVIPFLILIMIASCTISEYTKNFNNKYLTALFYILLIFIGIDLFYQLLNWSISASEIPSGGVKPIPHIGIVDTVGSDYKLVVLSTWIFSLCAMATSLYWLKSISKK